MHDADDLPDALTWWIDQDCQCEGLTIPA